MTQNDTDVVVDIDWGNINVVKHIGRVAVKDIVTDPRVQRSQLNATKLNEMVTHFDEHALGTLVLSLRANGNYIALDGWHRSEACKLVPHAPTMVDALIFEGLTIEQEAHYFRLYNTRTVMHTVDAFRVQAIEGVPQAVRITNILSVYGLHVGHNSFAAVAAAVRISEYPKGLVLFDTTLQVIDAVWGCTKGSLDGRLVEGIAAFLRYYGDRVSGDKLAKKLSKYDDDNKGNDKGFTAILKTAVAYHQAKRGPFRIAVADVLTGIYNKGERTADKLPDYQRHTPIGSAASNVLAVSS